MHDKTDSKGAWLVDLIKLTEAQIATIEAALKRYDAVEVKVVKGEVVIVSISRKKLNK